MSDSGAPLPGTRLLRIAELWLEPADVERFIAPAIADLQHEYQDAAARPEPWTTSARIVAMIAGLSVRQRFAATTQASWWPVLPTVGAVVFGILHLRAAGIPTGGLLKAQCTWLAIAVLSAWAVATTPPRVLQRTALAFGFGAVVVLAITAWRGESLEGASRWLRVGPLAIHSGALVLPFLLFALTTSLTGGRRRAAALVVGTAQLALLAQPDGATALILACATCGVAIEAGDARNWRTMAGCAALFVGAGWALLRAPALSSVPHVEGVLRLESSLIFGVAAFASLALVPMALAMWVWKRPRSSGRTLAIAMATALLIAALLPAFGPYPIPLVAYGGSSIVGIMIGLALVISTSTQTSRSRAPEGAAPPAVAS